MNCKSLLFICSIITLLFTFFGCGQRGQVAQDTVELEKTLSSLPDSITDTPAETSCIDSGDPKLITIESPEVKDAFQAWKQISWQPYFDSINDMNSETIANFFAYYCMNTTPDSFEEYNDAGWFKADIVDAFAYAYFGLAPEQIKKMPNYDETKGYAFPLVLGLPADRIELKSVEKIENGFTMEVIYTYVTPPELADAFDKPRIETAVITVSEFGEKYRFISCIQKN